jgi:predicted acetyltransferase
MSGSDEIVLQRAGNADKPIIENLIQLYLYDMAGANPFPIGEDGRYEYDFLERFWQHPYLFRVGGEIAGFALVIDHCPITGQDNRFFMAEFFVMRPYRRQAVGRMMFRRICALHPGKWHVAHQTQNVLADTFWTAAFGSRGVETFGARHDGADWILRAFEAGERQVGFAVDVGEEGR